MWQVYFRYGLLQYMEQRSLFKKRDEMKKYNKALVIGKFQPLHKGHLALIDFAATQAETVVVCVTAHEGEIIPLSQRELWLNESYRHDKSVIVCGLSYDPTKLNESSVSDLKSSEDWAEYIRANLEDFSGVDVIVGSEQYVKYMADYLGLGCVIYDEKRENMPISATDIKGDIIRYWDYLSPAAKRSYVQHICICGSESTGKSTVCKRMEEEYDFVTMIPEIGRCLVGKSGLCKVETLKKIFTIHNDLLSAVRSDPPTPIVLWDTDNITTLSYLAFLHSANQDVFTEVMGDRKAVLADKYFFFESNIAFHDDGTRFDLMEARLLSAHHKYMYSTYGISLKEITDEDRCDVVRKYILQEIELLKHAFETDKR